MKTIYLECAMGAAGDMLTAALLELCPDREDFLRQINEAGIPGVTVSCLPERKCGIGGSRVSVTINGHTEESIDASEEEKHSHGDREHHHHEEHSHSGYTDICKLISGLKLPDEVKANAQAVYHLIAEAESEVHGTTVTQIHFHEVGAMDAVADITAFCLLMHLLKPSSVTASPVNVGGGFVKCAHGVLPVPAPAAALLLQGVPTYGGKVQAELCTPTGAALLKYFVTHFGDRPVMTVEKIGCGMGKKDFDTANCVRAFYGEATEAAPTGKAENMDEYTDEISELSCNLDDMTPEAIAYACTILMERGALDAFTTPIGMKKGRPGVILTCLCRTERCKEFGRLLLSHTTTIGVRDKRCKRMVLHSEWMEVQTDYGPLRVKISRGYGVVRYKPEFEDVKRIAEQSGMSFDEIAAKADEAVRK